MRMILLGDHIRGEDASAFGLVADLSEPGTVLTRAIECATRLSEGSSSAVALAKEAISRGKAAQDVCGAVAGDKDHRTPLGHAMTNDCVPQLTIWGGMTSSRGACTGPRLAPRTRPRVSLRFLRKGRQSGTERLPRPPKYTQIPTRYLPTCLTYLPT